MTMVADPHAFYKVLGQANARPKLFGMGTIVVSAFLGSPLAAFALISANMRAKGDIRGEKVALGVGLLAVIICCVFAFHLTVPVSTIWFCASAMAAVVGWATHRNTVARHMEFDGQCHSPVYGVGISVILGLIVAALMTYGTFVL